MDKNSSATQVENQPTAKWWPALLRRLMVVAAIVVVVIFGVRWYDALADDAPGKGNEKDEAPAAKAGKAGKADPKDVAVPAKQEKAEPKDPAQEALGGVMDLMQEMLKAMNKPGGPGPNDLDRLMQVALQKAMQLQLQNLPALPGVPGQANPLPQQGGIPGAGQGFPGFPAMPGFPQIQFPQGGFPGFGPGFRGMFQPGFPGGLKPFGGFGPGWRMGGPQAKVGGAPGNVPVNGQPNVNIQREFDVTHQEGGEAINVQGTVNNGVVTIKGITITANGMTQQYQNLDQVPQAHRPTVNALIEQQMKASQPLNIRLRDSFPLPS
jgi:hypothetical protein